MSFDIQLNKVSRKSSPTNRKFVVHAFIGEGPNCPPRYYRGQWIVNEMEKLPGCLKSATHMVSGA